MKNKCIADRLFRTAYNRELTKTRKEINTLPSMTQPDMGYSLREILDRFTNGMPLNVAKPYYYEENENEDFDAYDETRNPDFDLADASQQLHDINEEKQYKKHRLQKTDKTEQKTPPTKGETQP